MVSYRTRPSPYPFINWNRAGPLPFGVRRLGLSCASGALAQLGERLICIQEVIGSIPIGSTMPRRGCAEVGFEAGKGR
jgi:hypothetical protein